MQSYELDFYGLKRTLPLTAIGPAKLIASFTLLGDLELTEKAAEEMEKQLKKKNISPDCFVAPEANAVPLIYTLAKRFGHARYVILRKNVRSYMKQYLQVLAPPGSPKHLTKLVLDKADADFIAGKTVVLLDDIVSTGATMELAVTLLRKTSCTVVAKGAIFKQADGYPKDLLYLGTLPLFTSKAQMTE